MSTKHSGKRKSSIPSDSPQNKAERERLKFAKTPSMYGYINLPVGHPPKTTNLSPPSADTALAPVTAVPASQASSVKVKMSNNSHGLYNKNNNMSGKDAWVTSMLLNNDRKLANKALFKAQPQAMFPGKPWIAF